MSSWWNEEVRFLQSPKDRAPKIPGQPIFPGLDKAAKDVALCAIALPAGLILGTVLGKVARSHFGRYIAHSIVRGLIYRQVGAFTGISLWHGGRK
jgi:hypothetical protein